MRNSDDTSKLSSDVAVEEPVSHVADLEPRTTISGEIQTSSSGVPLRTVTVRPIAPSINDDSSLGNSTDCEPKVSPSNDPYLGCVVDDRYRVEQVIGEGGMGIVYLCKHKIIGKRVAMKVLRADLARDQEVTRRFLNEARAASAIGNPHIIDISDFGQLPDGSTYFVMEHLDGVPLTRIIETCQPIPVSRILHIARQLAEALAAAHDAGIVHRDLKPDNIFLITRGNEKDFVKILDFGIAKVSTAEGRLTRVGTVFGTPHYMSPEQAAGAAIDLRGDIYALGVIMYEMTSGRVPFDADNFMGILTQHLYKAPVPIRALVPLIQDIPVGLETVILKCLSKQPEHRYQGMRELMEEIERIQKGEQPIATPEQSDRSGSGAQPQHFGEAHLANDAPAESRGVKRSKLRPLTIGASVVAALLLVGIVSSTMMLRESGNAVVNTSNQLGTATPVATPVTGANTNGSAAASEFARVDKQVVRITALPEDAHGFVGDKDIGTSPLQIEVSKASTVSLEVRRSGYVTKAINLDGSEGQLHIELDRKSGRSGRPPDAKGPKPAKGRRGGSELGGGEISDPWARHSGGS